ncbi:MAG: PIN domain-containing protein [Actinobacteria bacterium]|nr:PIN domain-containing protein [Actinomycetota bacterium]
MIVLDASAIVELITDARGLAEGVRRTIDGDTDWVIPGHTVAEVANALRGIARGTGAPAETHRMWIAALARFEFDERSVVPLLSRIVEMSANANAYDAAYIALGEALGVPVLTTDAKLAAIPGRRTRVFIVA